MGGDVKRDWPRSGKEIFAFVPTSVAAPGICDREFMSGLNMKRSPLGNLPGRSEFTHTQTHMHINICNQIITHNHTHIGIFHLSILYMVYVFTLNEFLNCFILQCRGQT